MYSLRSIFTIGTDWRCTLHRLALHSGICQIRPFTVGHGKMSSALHLVPCSFL
jgi:hypothetical protein